MASPPQDSQRETPRAPGALWFWWLVLLALLVWNAVTFLPTPRPEISIPYTTLLAQVRAGNVAKVRIARDQIRGSFAKPLQWPQPALDTTPSPASGEPDRKPSGPPAAAPAAAYTTFTTTFPQAIADPTLLPLLEAHNVVVDAASPPTHWLAHVLTEGLPFLLLLVFFGWMGGKAAQGQSGLFRFGPSKARRYSRDHPEVTFAEVAGADEAKAELQEEVDFLRHPQKYHDLGARIPRGVLLVAPPGTGKTLLARAVAGEAGVPFFSLSASEFVEMFVGVGASRVRDLFTQAKAPSIVFIDELDAVGRRRGAGVDAINSVEEMMASGLETARRQTCATAPCEPLRLRKAGP